MYNRKYISSYRVYDWNRTRTYYHFIPFFATSYYFSYRLLIYVNPDCILISFAVLLILESVFVQLVTWTDSIVGSGVIFLLLYCMQKIYPEGLGGGDIKLLSLLGFIVGVKGVFIVLFLASCFSLCFFRIGIVLKRIEVRKPIPFGPFIKSWGNVLCISCLFKLERESKMNVYMDDQRVARSGMCPQQQ